jgi:hypothetical protein
VANVVNEKCGVLLDEGNGGFTWTLLGLTRWCDKGIRRKWADVDL